MDGSARLPWPPIPDEAPTLGDVFAVIEDLMTRGTERYRREEDAYRRKDPEEWAAFEQLQERLEGEELELLMRFEARSNYTCALWGEDRFRIGFALGAGAGRFFSE